LKGRGDSMERLEDKIKGFPLPTVGAAFLIGLLVGWLAIGWWLWPVGWTEADPWDLRPEHQDQYLSLVARAYSRNPDQARKALAGWDSAPLSHLLTDLQSRTTDPEARQQLTDLALVLGLPRGEAAPTTGSAPAPRAPLLKSRLATVCLTGLAGLAVVVLIIFAASTRPCLPGRLSPPLAISPAPMRRARRIMVTFSPSKPSMANSWANAD